jgi:hypothetical protein
MKGQTWAEKAAARLSQVVQVMDQSVNPSYTEQTQVPLDTQSRVREQS